VPDDTKVFDVSKPGRAAPQSTSRPIIVDNNPTMSDPMMAENSASAPEVSAPLSTSIQVSMGDEEESVNVNKSPVPSAGTTFEPNPNEANSGINPSSMPEVPSQMPETLGSAGLVKSNVNLPFHIFNKQKKSTVTTNPKSVA
jgi:hypothetical protein